MTSVVLAHSTNVPTTTKSEYRLQCMACPWEVDAPLNYHMARLIAWGHQTHVSAGPKHAVSFVPVRF